MEANLTDKEKAAEGESDGFDFKERLSELNEELEMLNAEVSRFEKLISESVAMLLQ